MSDLVSFHIRNISPPKRRAKEMARKRKAIIDHMAEQVLKPMTDSMERGRK